MTIMSSETSTAPFPPTVVPMADAVRWAKSLMEDHGPDALLHMGLPTWACACPGRPTGYGHCYCVLNLAVWHHRTAILNEFDPDAALQLMRLRIVQALR